MESKFQPLFIKEPGSSSGRTRPKRKNVIPADDEDESSFDEDEEDTEEELDSEDEDEDQWIDEESGEEDRCVTY